MQGERHKHFIAVSRGHTEGCRPSSDFPPPARLVEALKAHAGTQFKAQVFKRKVIGRCPGYLRHKGAPNAAVSECQGCLDPQDPRPMSCEVVRVAGQQ
jgi:hypothetical protein